MDFSVFIAVLAAAMLHAGWNAVVKTGGDKSTAMMLVAVGNGVIGLGVALMFPWPDASVWMWIFASGVIRTIYYLALGYAYEHGDLSRVYPVARGAAPIFLLLVGPFFLGDHLSGMEQIGVLVLGGGILMMARGVFTDGESKRLLPFALASATATASYSMTDGTGARLMQDAVAFTGWALAMTSVIYLPIIIAFKGRSILQVNRREMISGTMASFASYAAYTIVVWAMTQAPVTLVAALRETSILFAILIGWGIVGERIGRGKLIASFLILAGVVLTRI